MSAATGLGFFLAGCMDSLPRATRKGPPTSYGALLSDPDGILALPEGFSYRILAEQGETRLESGEKAPRNPDGAAAFPALEGGGTVLICNHEIDPDGSHPVPHLEGLVYDPNARGGTTTLEIDEQGQVVRHYVSLAGTTRNCAGGRTPWNTWLSGEETEDEGHGYVFEVDPYDESANRDPRPIKALGRFAHEAVAVDPDAQVLYLTEDAADPNGLFYRYTPPQSALPLRKGSLRALADDDGVLEAMRATTADGRHVPDLSEATEVDTVYGVDWVPVPDRDATRTSVRTQFSGDQITRGQKLEGMWWGDGGAYVVSSFSRPEPGSGTKHDGQVWFFDPAENTLTLRLLFGANDNPDDGPDGPDNITVSPFGGVIIAEDGDGKPNLVGATPDNDTYYLARADVEDANEFCGPVFSPDRKTLFANLQGPGYVFAITGPFSSSS